MSFIRLKLLMLLTTTLGSCSDSFAQVPQRGCILQYGVFAEPPSDDCHASVTCAVMHCFPPHYSNFVWVRVESWAISTDNRSFTLKRRSNVKLHDESTQTFDDVGESYDIKIAPSPNILSAREGLFETVTKVENPDSHTVC